MRDELVQNRKGLAWEVMGRTFCFYKDIDGFGTEGTIKKKECCVRVSKKY